MTVKELIQMLNELENHDATIDFVHEFYCEIEQIRETSNSANIYEVILK